jgi:predicted transcriptional regulator
MDAGETTGRHVTKEHGPQSDNPMDLESILEVLQDDDCRQLLDVIDTDPQTTKELAKRSDIPLSTVYRKLDLLIDSNIIEKTSKIAPNENHAAAYHLSVESLVISVNIQERVTNDILIPSGSTAE